MIVEQIWTGNAYRNFNYLIVCPESGEALAIDPLDHEKCLSRAKDKGWDITQILNTHEHGDHTGGNRVMVAATGAKLLAHANARDKIPGIDQGLGAGNVIPGHVDILFNFRFSPARPAAQLRVDVETLCRELELSFEIDWTVFGEPFHTSGGRLVEATVRAIGQETGLTTVQSTSGGTSDGRFIAPSGAEVLELGPVNRSIHDIDEHVSVAGLETLSRIYQRLLETLLLD